MIDTELSCLVRIAKAFERIADALEKQQLYVSTAPASTTEGDIPRIQCEIKTEKIVTDVFDLFPATKTTEPATGAEETKLTETDVRKAVADHVKKHGTDSGRAILKRFGDGMVASIKKEDYRVVINLLTGASNG